MDISKRPTSEGLELAVSGRLDAYWADHLSKALEEAVHDGAHHIRLDMAGVPYVSSVGIRVLLKFYKELRRLRGSFAVRNPSDAVKTVLELAGLETLMAVDAPRPEQRAGSVTFERDGAMFEVFDVSAGAGLRCRLVGDPERLPGPGFAASHGRTVRFPDSNFGLGLGGFGTDFEDCKSRFGEFLALAGTAAYLPTDGTNVPDEFIASKALVPQLEVLYALVCEGAFAKLARFEANAGSAVKVSELASACLDLAGSDAVGIAMIAESAGLVGAALRRSPAVAFTEGAPFAYPQIREWLSFTPERAFLRSLVVAVGVAIRTELPTLAPLLRPLGARHVPAGHFHAAVFSYRPLAKGWIELGSTVSNVFAVETLQSVLHLINDDRPGVGLGESELRRGACWVAPLTDVVAEPG